MKGQRLQTGPMEREQFKLFAFESMADLLLGAIAHGVIRKAPDLAIDTS